MADKTVTYRLLADISQFKAQMANAAASTKAAADMMTGATKEGVKFRAGLATLGSTAGKVGLVAAAGLGAAVVSAANFDEAMAHVQAATHESASNMDLLRTAALEAGARTVFSATEAANAIEELSKAGVSVTDILGGGLDSALDLAAAGTLDVGQAAEIAATTMNQFHIAGSDSARVADVLAAAAGKAQGEVTDIAEALKYVGPVADQMGVSLEETAGSIAYLATQGIQGEQAGTGLRGMLLSLTSPSKVASDTMKQLGINLYDAKGNFVGLDGVAGQLHATMGDLTNAERDEALGRIFGNAQVTTARILYSGGADAVTKWTNAVDDSGYASETAATKMNSLKGDLEKLGGALQTALIGAGSDSQGPLRGLVQNLTGVIDAFNDMPPAAKSATTGLLGVTAVLGGGLWFSSKVITGVADMRQALTDLGPAGTKAAGALKAVGTATAIVGGVLILRDAINSLEGSMRDAVPGTEELVGRLLDLSSGDLGSIGTQFSGIADGLDRLKAGGSANQFLPDIIGLLPGMTSANEEINSMKDQVAGLDSALASIANNGSADKARQAFASLAASLNLSGEQQRQLLGFLPQYKEALAGSANAGKLAGEGGKAAADGFKEAGDAAGGATSQVQSFKGALESLQGILDQRAALRDYEASFDAFVEGFKKLKTAGVKNDFDIRVKGGQENEALLDAIVAKTALVAQGYHKMARIEFVQGAITRLKALAKTFDIPKSETDALIAKLQALGRQRPTPKADFNTYIAQKKINTIEGQLAAYARLHPTATANVETGTAMSRIQAVQNALNGIHDKSVTITTYHRSVGGRSVGNNGLATGGEVHGPGTATSDSIPARLSNGEFVMQAAAVNKYGTQMMHELNAMRFAAGGYVQRYAGGGSVRPSAAVTLPDGFRIVGRLFTDNGPGTIDAVVVSDGSYDAARARMSVVPG